MSIASRSTLIVHGRLAARTGRLAAARAERHGLGVMSFEQAAVRLAGGFVRPIDDESLRVAIQNVLPTTPMGELEKIKGLPGMVDASVETLRKIWNADIELPVQPEAHPRLDAIARLEAAVLAQLPIGMLRPVDIAALALGRIRHAPTVLGSIDIVGVTELSPCWRGLLRALTKYIPVQWTAGPRAIPAWLEEFEDIKISRSEAESPRVENVSAATFHHEAIEAMRWVRSLLVSGVKASDIAIASTSPADYDEYFLALRADANIDLHFVHGISTLATRDGQMAAALATIVVRGLSQSRLRRLAGLCRGTGLFEPLPIGWLSILPADAPLSTTGSWKRFLSGIKPQDWPDGADHSETLRVIVDLLGKGPQGAVEIGDAFLRGRALTIWRKSLLAGPAASIDVTLETLKQDDGVEACVSVAWMPASSLAISPRCFVRLLGLNSSRWPRGLSEDRLIPDHLIPVSTLDPLPINLADRRDFDTILKTTTREVILSHARRENDGRLLGRSPLLAERGEETYLYLNATPANAFSETDRLLARSEEFAQSSQAICAKTCWRHWLSAEVTPHDGLIRPDHPLVIAVLERVQSASSLRRLLRNPIGFIWNYGLGWREPQSGTEPLVLDAASFGNLVHLVLDRALRELAAAEGLANASEFEVAKAVERALEISAVDWEREQPVPPAIVWMRTKDDARAIAIKALSYRGDAFPAALCYSEVPFGGSEPRAAGQYPWDIDARVEIPDTGFSIAGYIDRLDISSDGQRALVRDYKTGRPPKANISLDGGRELQRCLYAFATKALLGEHVEVTASLLFPRELTNLELNAFDAVLADVRGYLRAARTSLASGAALLGPDTGAKYDDLAFALPANASAVYIKRKLPAVTKRLGDAVHVWEAH